MSMTWKKILEMILEHYFKKHCSTNVLGNTHKKVWGKNTDNSDLKVIQKNWTWNANMFEVYNRFVFFYVNA